jgi:hypothetical protein
MNQLNTYKSLQDFRDYVVQKAKYNLVAKNSSGTLSKELDKSYVKVTKNGFEMAFTMPIYGMFQDKGVSGKKTVYTTPYSFKNKMPPTKALDKWVVKKGIAPRGKDGKFLSREGLKFAIARKIFLYGIKPSLFFTKPFNEGYDKYINQELEKSFALDVEELLKYTLKDIKWN